jgi:hypothetical protein
MPTNLNSRPIEGYITDNAGNILRNVDVVIKDDAPNGSVVIDVCKSDDDGYFISKPIKNGVYDIYESGVRVYRQYHSSFPTVIQCYKPYSTNEPSSDILPFSDFVGSEAPDEDINFFRYYIQIEPENIDISTYGHLFPLWKQDGANQLTGHDFENIALVHDGFTVGTSYLTHTRFDVEYFSPLYTQNSDHKRMRWSGVPGVSFADESKIVLPLDYFSITPNQPHYYYNDVNGTWGQYLGSEEIVELSDVPTDVTDNLITGDILKLELAASQIFWCIVHYIDGTTVYATRWKSSRANSANLTTIVSAVGSDFDVYSYRIYKGFYANLENLTDSVSEYFTVKENQAAQNSISEEYNYSEAV